MTKDQEFILDLIRRLNKDEFENWFTPASVMAFVQIESSFRTHAYRREPSGVASYGLMQVLDVTARDFGLVGKPDQMYVPEVGLRIGMKVARKYWDILRTKFGHNPTLAQWAASYNEGPGNVMKGRPDTAYVVPWLAARNFWLKELKG
jgi:soluble lytic murein transglycosylase-like protein